MSKKHEVAKAYNALGGRIYDIRYAEEQKHKIDSLLERIKPEPSELVLDIGCGTGLLMENLASIAVGLDISLALLKKAKERSKANQSIVLGDAELLPFKGPSFDIIFAVTLLQNIPNPLKILKEIQRVGRKDSRVALTALKKAFTRHQFKILLSDAGFKSYEVLGERESKDWLGFVYM